MDAKEALDKIKTAEIQAEEIIQQAEAESVLILRQAQREKLNIIASARERAMLQAQELKAQTEAQTSQEVQMINDRRKEVVRNLEDQAKNKQEKAVTFILEKTK